MIDVFVVLLVIWNAVLTMLFLFDKSRIDTLETCMGRMVKHLNEKEKGANDWK